MNTLPGSPKADWTAGTPIGHARRAADWAKVADALALLTEDDVLDSADVVLGTRIAMQLAGMHAAVAQALAATGAR